MHVVRELPQSTHNAVKQILECGDSVMRGHLKESYERRHASHARVRDGYSYTNPLIFRHYELQQAIGFHIKYSKKAELLGTINRKFEFPVQKEIFKKHLFDLPTRILGSEAQHTHAQIC